MRRGDIWTVAGGKDYAGKPRRVVLVQDDSFDATNSITICAFTTDQTDATLFRLPVEPNERNGLRAACVTGAKVWVTSHFLLAPIRWRGFFARCAAAILSF